MITSFFDNAHAQTEVIPFKFPV